MLADNWTESQSIKKVPKKGEPKLKSDVKQHPTLKDCTKKKMKNDIDKITKTLNKLNESIEKHDEHLKEKKEKLDKLNKQKEELVILNNQF